MDPATIAVIIFGAVNGAIQLAELAIQIFEIRHDEAQNTSKEQTRLLFQTGTILLRSRARRAGQLCDQNLNRKTVKEVQPVLQAYQKLLEEPNTKDSTTFKQDFHKFLDLARTVLERNELISVSNKLPVDLSADEQEAETNKTTDFCGGAILLQRRKSPMEDIFYNSDESPSKRSLGAQYKRCKDCSLWVDVLPAFNLQSLPALVASCHLLRSGSERKAFYRCKFCYQNTAIFDYRSSDDLQMHILLVHQEEIMPLAKHEVEETIPKAELVLKETLSEDEEDNEKAPLIKEEVPSAARTGPHDGQLQGTDRPAVIDERPSRSSVEPPLSRRPVPTPDQHSQRYNTPSQPGDGILRRHLTPNHPSPPRSSSGSIMDRGYGYPSA